MSFWAETSKRNLFSLSQEQEDFQIAVKEWKHTGIVTDHLDPIEVCQLCEKPNLRYHFEILNRETENLLQVGSSCIEKFNISVFDEDGNELHGKDKSNQLKEEIAAKQEEMMLMPIRELWKIEKEERDEVKWHVDQFKHDGGFKPAGLLYCFKLMGKNEIEYASHIYKVSLRGKNNKIELYRMSEEDKALIWPSLTSPQKQQYEKGKAEFVKQQEEAEQRQKNAIEGYQNRHLSEIPPHYSEKMHKYKITFLDKYTQPLDRFFEGDFEEARQYIEQKAENNPKCAKVEVRITLTNELIDTFTKR